MTPSDPTPASSLTSTDAVYNVLLERSDAVEAGLVLLAKAAARKGLSPLTWTWGEVTTKREARPTEPGFPARFHDVSRREVTIHGGNVRLAGWRFLARLQYVNDQTVILAMPGETIPAEYRNAGRGCDHCKHDRRRASTFVLAHDDGRTTQVGSTCLADFTGNTDALKLASSASYYADARILCLDDEGPRGSNPPALLATYMGLVAWAIRTRGWVSIKNETELTSSTAQVAYGALISDKERLKLKVNVTQEDADLAAAAVAWAAGLSDETIAAERGDYMHNVRAVARGGLAARRTLGIAASILPAYGRAMGKDLDAKRAPRPASVHVGTVGERETFAAHLDFVTGFETQFGYTTVLKFITAEGAVLVWKASSTNLTLQDIGKRFAVTGTVKDHGDYKGQLQTMLSRCAVEELAEGEALPPPKKGKAKKTLAAV